MKKNLMRASVLIAGIAVCLALYATKVNDIDNAQEISFDVGYEYGYGSGYTEGYIDGQSGSRKGHCSGPYCNYTKDAVFYITDGHEKIYHRISCSELEDEDIRSFRNEKDAESAGFDPCSECN